MPTLCLQEDKNSPQHFTLGRSLMKWEKRVRPRMELCGTPEVVEPIEDVESDTRVTCERSDR